MVYLSPNTFEQNEADMSNISIHRLAKSLFRLGIDISYVNGVYTLSQKHNDHVAKAQILLPGNLPLEKKAIEQLISFASVSHPEGGRVLKTIATPDFHSGSIVPVGAVVATSKDMLIPQAIGTDIHCGMRLHITDIKYDEFLLKKSEFVQKLKGDLFLGTRDLPMHVQDFTALFEDGIKGFIDSASKNPLGQCKKASFSQLKHEVERIFQTQHENGSSKYAPDYLKDLKRNIIRDSYLGTLGGGNHFLEIQKVNCIFDKVQSYKWGIKKDNIAIMIHTGSRSVGVHVGNSWMEYAKSKWPNHLKHPTSDIYPLYGEKAHQYLQAIYTASHYAKLNRMLIAELARIRLREVFAKDIEIPLIYDAPHNIITQENNCFVHRKGATLAYLNQPVLIPGSMGDLSYLMRGLGNKEFLNSASHGAGRAMSRFEVSRKHKHGVDIGLGCVECITLKDERKIEEAPAAYKNINDVIEIQQCSGIVAPIANFQPILTFKG